ncbi:hypothetical protein [Staphylococcus hominis]
MFNKFYLHYRNENKVKKMIKTRNDIIEIMIECLNNFIIITEDQNKNYNLGFFEIISNDNYDRLYISTNTKIYSFIIPFKIDYENKKITLNNLDVDIQILTFLNELIEIDWFSEKNKDMDLLDKAAAVEEALKITNLQESLVNEKLTQLCIHLLSFEIGYVRYDDDEGGENKNGVLFHPRYHLDINYNKKSTYKLGLKKEFNSRILDELIDSSSECYFLDLHNK